MSTTPETPAALSRRDWFAAMAMQGSIAGRYDGCQIDIEWTAIEAVRLADALIAELDKPLETPTPPTKCVSCENKPTKEWCGVPICDECWEKLDLGSFPRRP